MILHFKTLYQIIYIKILLSSVVSALHEIINRRSYEINDYELVFNDDSFKFKLVEQIVSCKPKHKMWMKIK